MPGIRLQRRKTKGRQLPRLGALWARVVSRPCFLPGVLLSSNKTSKSIILHAFLFSSPSCPQLLNSPHSTKLICFIPAHAIAAYLPWLPVCKETNFLLKHFPLDLLFSPPRKLRSGSRCCVVAAVFQAPWVQLWVLWLLRSWHPRSWACSSSQPGLLPAPCSHKTWVGLGRRWLHFPLGPIIFQALSLLLERLCLASPINKNREQWEEWLWSPEQRVELQPSC